MSSETETVALHLIRALDDAPDGRPMSMALLPMSSSSLPSMDGYRLKAATSH
jgi:hypothetical protein